MIRGDGVVVDLRGQIKVNSPLLDSRTVDANAQANVTLNNGNGVVDRFGVGVSSTGIGGPSSATSLSGSWTHSVGNNFSTGISAQRTWTGGRPRTRSGRP